MKTQRLNWIVWAAGLGVLPGTSALAEGPYGGFYFGIFGGLATVDLPSKREFDEAVTGGAIEGLPPGTSIEGTSSLDDNDNSWGVQIGYRWNSHVAAELGYVDFGREQYKADIVVGDGATQAPMQLSERFLSSGPTLSVLGMLPVSERFDVHGRAGVYFSDTRTRTRIDDPQTDEFVSVEPKASAQDLFAGIGAAWNINYFYSVRLEYQRFFDVGDEEHTGETDIDLITFAVLFR